MIASDDLDLCRRLLAADDLAWREFLRMYHNSFRCIAQQLNSLTDFDDLFGSFVLKLLGSTDRPGLLHQFDGRARLSTFLSLAFRHHVIDHHRTAHQHEPLDCDPADLVQPSPADYVIAQDEETRLLHALGRLSTRHRLLIELHYYQGHSLRNIATMLGTSKSTIARELTAAVVHLRRLMQNNGTEPPLNRI